ncbi:MAG: GntR family transcriptional regulator [Anaerolineae bacterium]
MPKELVTAEEIRQAVIQRISSRQYLPGDRLPSVRDLAEELGSNRNTVNKAYQLLEELGYIESLPGGRKGFSVKDISGIETQSRGDLRSYFYQQSVNLVWQALAAGLSAEEVREQILGAVTEVYDTSRVKIAFYECNMHDSHDMGAFISQALDMNIHYGLLDDLYTSVDATLPRYDLIVTTFHHLAEVSQSIPDAGVKLVGIDTRLTPETMLRIARLPKSNIGVVSTLQNTSHMLKHILYSYYPGRTIHAATINETDAVKRFSDDCDHVLATYTCAEQVAELIGRAPDVIIDFQVDEQSIQFLKRRIHEIQARKSEALSLSVRSSG